LDADVFDDLCRSENVSPRRRKRGSGSAAVRQNGRRRSELTPEQRRQEVIDVLAAALAEMPAALALPDGTAASIPPTSPPDGGRGNSGGRSPNNP
jgi:hypothetical protein